MGPEGTLPTPDGAELTQMNYESTGSIGTWSSVRWQKISRET